MKPRKYNEGDRHGRWTLVEYPFDSKKGLLRCDCGFEAWRFLSNWKRSEGCKNCSKKDPALLTYQHTMRTAQRREIEWALTFEDWLELSGQDCHYCGRAPSNMVAKYGHKYNGIDRVDSAGSYERSNCVTACKVCNRSKSDMSQEEFFDWIRQVYNAIER